MPALTRSEYKKSVRRLCDIAKDLVIACADPSIDTRNNVCISFMELLYVEDSFYILLKNRTFRPKFQEKCREFLTDPLACDHLRNITLKIMKRFDL